MSRDPFRDEPIIAMREPTRASDAPQDCFKDEIAIDFPSIHRLVERVRDAFLGDEERFESDTLTREVRLSNREARRGTLDPTYLVYTLGKMEILKLRDEWRQQLEQDSCHVALRSHQTRAGFYPGRAIPTSS